MEAVAIDQLRNSYNLRLFTYLQTLRNRQYQRILMLVPMMDKHSSYFHFQSDHHRRFRRPWLWCCVIVRATETGGRQVESLPLPTDL